MAFFPVAGKWPLVVEPRPPATFAFFSLHPQCLQDAYEEVAPRYVPI